MLNSQAQKTLYGLMDMIYPVGSYYITESSDLNTKEKMATKFGGTWEQLDDGRFLEAVTGGAGSDKPAGLPNITGTFCGGDTDIKSGAFTSSVGNGSKVGSGSAQFRTFTFNANSGASVKGIYGNSNTVQPKSRTVYIYRRTALAGAA